MFYRVSTGNVICQLPKTKKAGRAISHEGQRGGADIPREAPEIRSEETFRRHSMDKKLHAALLQVDGKPDGWRKEGCLTD